jgi:tetratricopeptide (TPR) repeat protein
VEKFWNETKFADGNRFFDYKHAETAAPILKAQHPEFELWSQGVHARSGVACADCHMPYMRDGATKISDHWVRSPLLNMGGQVIGIITMKVTNGQNINLALGASRLRALRPGTMLTFAEMAARNKTGPAAEMLAEWWYRNGLNSLWLGNYDSALGYFENAVNKNPNRAEAWIQVGYCKVKQGKNADAIRAFQRAIKLRPNSFEAYNKLGDAYYYASRFTEAIESYKQAARIRPDLAEAYYNLGATYLEIGDRESAGVQLRALQPLDAKLHKKLLGEMK